MLDQADERFSEFQVWQDRNQDGVSQTSELMSLTDAGIASIDLSLTPTGQTLEGATDNVILNFASFSRTDGSIGQIGDVAFRYFEDPIDPAFTPQPEDAELHRLIQAMAAFGGWSAVESGYIRMLEDDHRLALHAQS